MKKLSPSMEDYLEAVYGLAGARGFARAKDISARLKVSRPSVNSALKNLSALGLVAHEHYGYARLTPSGLAAGSKIAELHGFLKDFFISVLCLAEAEAERDACRIEHAIGARAMANLRLLAEFIRTSRKGALAAEVSGFIKKRTGAI